MAKKQSPLDLLKAKLVSQAIQDPQFDEALKEAAKEIVADSKAAPNEATVESAFDRILYATLKGIGLLFNPTKEAALQTKVHKAKGRADSRLGGLIIEFKQPSTLRLAKDIAKAQQQVLDYLEAIGPASETLGFLTDGTKIIEIRRHADGSESISASEPLSGTALKKLVRAIISLESRALTARNLVADFCGDAHSGLLFELARELNDLLVGHATPKTAMLMSEWQELFRLSHEDQTQQQRIADRRAALAGTLGIPITSPEEEYRALFALHTAYAILLKLIAYRVVCDVRFGEANVQYRELTIADTGALREFLANLEDGEIFRALGILNLLEGDFFSWYADAAQWNDGIADEVRKILQTLSHYEDSREIFASANTVDLFRTLYEATVPQTVRSSLGEFYTPYWLAEHVLESSKPEGNWSVLDPCCGSGTFLLAAISRLRGELKGKRPKAALKDILRRVAGIDLNPLAVLTSRIHYFIHVSDLLAKIDGELTIPVYLGDASNMPSIVEEGGVSFHYYSLRTLKDPLEVFIPRHMTSDLDRFSRVMLEFEQAVKLHDFDEGTERLLAAAEAHKHPAIVGDKLRELAAQIILLEQSGWNGIWSRIIANFISTARLGPFTNLIGNPPWIDWKSLPSGYRETVKGLCIEKGLFSGAKRTGGINLNVCALVAHVSATNWLAPKGRMAFLMPRELAIQASYEGWREAIGGPNCSLREIHDWNGAGHPFDPVKEDFLTFVYVNSAASQIEVPVYEYTKTARSQRAHKWVDWAEAASHLVVSKGFARRLIGGSTQYTFAKTKKRLTEFQQIAGASAYKGREGIEFYPQELLLFTYLSPGPRKGTAWFRNVQVSRSKYKVPSQKILLETKYMFPLVKGPGIEAFNYKDPNLIVAFPYEAANPHAPIGKAKLKSQSPLLLKYFETHKKRFEEQTDYSDTLRGEGEYYGLARTGPYSFQDTYVAYRDNSKWRATVIDKKEMPWGENKRFLFQNHAVSICEREKGVYISHREACYIAAILNCPIVEQFIYSSSDNRSFKIRPPIKIPLFDATDKRHRELAKLGSLALKDPNKWASVSSKAEAEYLSICKGPGASVKAKVTKATKATKVKS